ncbi:MAG TPA: hypothetical protein VFE30_09420 [Anaeromyxobacteraceae bacterium]|jgi:DNA-binding beta-propeller fold protein YncE|nr:hypothetical protein [Anaeromyxobacteraceae bacterium]
MTSAAARGLLLALLCAAACATAQRPPVPAIAYPPAPQQARAFYRGEIRSDQDVETSGFWHRLATAFAGERKPVAFEAPTDVTFDPSGRLLVTDAGRHALVIVDRSGGHFDVVAPTGEDALGLPLGVAADGAGRIYVADGLRRTVRVFSPEGKSLARIDAGGQLQRPTGVAVDRARGLLYVADTPVHLVRVLRLDGTPVRTLGGHGEGPGQMNFPTFLSVGPRGELVVNDAMNFRVQVFGPEGELRSTFGQLGSGSGDMSRSKGVAMDERGHVFVADALFDNFQIFDRSGRLLLFVGEHGRAAGQFWMPTGLALDGPLVAVADRSNGRVQLFEMVTEAELEEGEAP